MIYLVLGFIVFSILFMVCACRVSGECARLEESTEYNRVEKNKEIL